MKSDIISEGLARRIIFVYGDKRSKYVPFPTLSQEQATAWTDLEKEVKALDRVGGEFHFTKDATDYWDALYRRIQEEAEHQDIILQHYFTTKHILMLKVSMCLSAVLRNDRHVDRALLEIVHELFLSFEDSLPTLFKSMGRNELRKYEDKLEEFISIVPEGRPMKEIAEFIGVDVDPNETRLVLDNLITRGKVKNKITGANTSLYISTSAQRKLISKNLFDLITSYVPSTAEIKLTRAQPISLDRLCSPEVKHILEKNAETAELNKRGILLRRSKPIQ
jgi:hypothetical protein